MSYRQSGTAGGYTEPLAAQGPEPYSLIDRHSTVEGTFTSDRDLRIEGQMRGTLRCQGLVYVAEGADVDATVESANMTVAGQLRGNVTCRGKLQIMPSGRVFATVTTETLVINEGAIYEGELHMDLAGAGGAPSTSAFEAEANAPALLRRFSAESGESSSTLPQAGKRASEES